MVLNMGQLLSLPFVAAGLIIALLGHKNHFPQGPFPNGETYHFKDNQKKQKK